MPPHSPGFNQEDYLAAHRMNFLVNEGEVDPVLDKLWEISDEEFKEILALRFDGQYSQNLYHPREIKPLTPGQEIERGVVAMLSAFLQMKNPDIRAEHGTMIEDQGEMKSDLILRIKDIETPVYVQLTTRTDEGVVEKFNKLPAATIPVILPSIKKAMEIQARGNPLDNAGMLKDIFRQILAGMRARPQIYSQHLDRLLGTV